MDLPSNLIDDILSRLSVRDAAKTSVLSSTWRSKWAMVPSLVLNDKSFPISEDREGRTMIDKLVSDIDRVLLLHSGSIQKFELSYFHGLPTNDVDRWILHLRGNSIKEFALECSFADNGYYKLPSCVFSWQNLTCLDLIGCFLKPPSTFKGFKNLKSLDLCYVTLAQDAFDNLISGCPLLERLTLLSPDDVSHFNINAPNLQSFNLAGRFVYVSLKNTPHLAEFSVTAFNSCNDFSKRYIRHHNNLIELLAQMPQIERLCIDDCALESSYENNRETSSNVWQADQ